MENIIYPNGELEVKVSAGKILSIYSFGSIHLYKKTGYPQLPVSWKLQKETIPGETYLTSVLSVDAYYRIEAGASVCIFDNDVTTPYGLKIPNQPAGGIAIQTGSGRVLIGDTTATTNPTSGALVVSGGIGVVGNANMGGVVYAADTIKSTKASAQFRVGIDGTSTNDWGILSVGNDLQIACWSPSATNRLLLSNTTPSTNTTTGSLVVSGGVGIAGDANIGGTLRVNGQVGFNVAPIAKPTITGSRGGNAALASLLTALANYGLITDSTSA